MIAPDMHVFVGPSNPDAALMAGLHRHPPVMRGDLATLLPSAPDLIMIIDGEFGQSLAVAVTEIRSLLRAGTSVWGAGSMGALRAAECWPLGMRGWGWVYGGYRGGRFSHDEDVALRFNHFTGRAATVPMVNIEWLCILAVSRGNFKHAEAEVIRALALATPWYERDEVALHEAAIGQSDLRLVERFWRFANSLPLAVRDRKRRDAELMLNASRTFHRLRLT
jgi:TfuA protein